MKIGFLSLFVQIALFGFAMLFHVEKQKKFGLKFITFSIASILICYFIEQIYSNPWLFLLPFFLNVLLLRLCYKISLFQAFFFCVIGYGLQNLTFCVCSLIDKVFPFVPGDYSNFVNYIRSQWLNWLLYFVFVLVSYFLFARKMKLTLVFGVKNIAVDVFCIVVLCLVYFVNRIWDASDVKTDVLFRILMMVCIITAIWMVLGIAAQAELKKENKAIEELLHKEEKLYKLSKEAIENINRKCHDLKYTVEAIKAGGTFFDENIKEIEDTVKQYDGFIRTGNKDLDIVMAEKCLKCNEKNISLSCMMDGKQIDFMKASDVYSLFGNLLDNAIEYLEKADNDENKLVSVNLQARNKFVVLHVENWCRSELKFVDGLPVTSKDDKENHGWGARSVKHIVEQYGGTVVFLQGDDTFSVNITFPIK